MVRSSDGREYTLIFDRPQLVLEQRGEGVPLGPDAKQVGVDPEAQRCVANYKQVCAGEGSAGRMGAAVACAAGRCAGELPPADSC